MKKFLSVLGLLVCLFLIAVIVQLGFSGLFFLVGWIMKMKVLMSLFVGFWCLLVGCIILSLTSAFISYFMGKLTTFKTTYQVGYWIIGIFYGFVSISSIWQQLDFNKTKAIIGFIYILIGMFMIISGGSGAATYKTNKRD